MVTSASTVLASVYPVRVRNAAATASSSLGVNGTRCSEIFCDPTSPRISTSHRENTIALRRWASGPSSSAQPRPSGPNANGLTRAGSPWPIANGSTPRARHNGSYSSFGSPSTRVRYPKSIIRRQKHLPVADLPRPGLPKMKTLGLVVAMSSRSTQPAGSAKKDPPDSWSMPICAPVGASPGAAMSGQNTGVCSEVIRHVDKGAGEEAHPAPTPMGPRAETSLGNRFASNSGPWTFARIGRSRPKSLSSSDTPRPARRRSPLPNISATPARAAAPRPAGSRRPRTPSPGPGPVATG